jgi:hypothetical protein
MSDKITIGRCKNCDWRSRDGVCDNEQKIHEDMCAKPGGDQADCLVYSYYEGGAFWVGPEFGCVHWKEKVAK